MAAEILKMDELAPHKERVYHLLSDACVNKYVRTLHNNGVTLQEGADSMVLTRPLRVLVKGSSAMHVATVCDVSDHAVTTHAHDLVEHTAVGNVLDEAVRREAPTNAVGKTLLHLLIGARGARRGACSRASTETPSMTRLRATPTFSEIFQMCGPKSNVHPCVLLTQATAVIITSYEDAGSKFRDRSSRMEASRHHAMAIDYVLQMPVGV